MTPMPEHQEAQSSEIVVAQPTALAQMAKIEIDSQIATAKQYPMHTTKEQIALFMEKVENMATCSIEVAESCHYRRPVGKENGKMKYAEGESVRLAELAVASYGNMKIQTFITEMQPKLVKAIARVHDMENNLAIEVEVTESCAGKDGRPFSERMRLVVAKAAQSKAFRDGAFKLIPKALLKPAIEAAAKVASGGELPIGERRTRVAKWIVSLGIDPNRVWKALEVRGLDDIQEEHLTTLFGIRTSMKDGDCTIDEAFPPEAPQATQQTGVAGVKEAMKGKSKKKTTEPVVKAKEVAHDTQEGTDATDGGKDAPLEGEKQADPTKQSKAGTDPASGSNTSTEGPSTSPEQKPLNKHIDPEPAQYQCTHCGSMEIVMHVVRGVQKPWCNKCISGKHVKAIK